MANNDLVRAFVESTVPATRTPQTIGSIIEVGVQAVADIIKGKVATTPALGLPPAPQDILGQILGTVPTYSITAVAQALQKKRRRMNVLNPYALGRAMRRCKGFVKFARRTVRITSGMKMQKAPSPRRKRR